MKVIYSKLSDAQEQVFRSEVLNWKEVSNYGEWMNQDGVKG